MTAQSFENVSAGTVARPAAGAQASVEERLARRTRGELTAGRVRPSGNTALLGLGRLLFGGYFIFNGVNHFANAEMMTGYARAKGVPLPGAGVALTGAMLLAGGFSLLSGTRPRVGSALIAGFLLGITPVMHRFWDVEDPQQASQEQVNFTKNAALLGAACITAAMAEPWPVSVDGLVQGLREA